MRTVAELSAEELDGLIERVREAAEHGLALSGEDLELLLSALVMLAELQQRMADSDITLQKLRKLAGIVKSSEKLSAVLPGKVDKNKSPKPKKPRRSGDQTGGGAEQPVIHQRCHHAIEGYTKGQRCPECERGTLSKYAPAVVLRISGQTPLIRTQHVLERLRCSTCGAYFTAEMPEEVKADGGDQSLYGYSARAVMALHKYFAGTPFYRYQTLQRVFGMPVSASTVFDRGRRGSARRWPTRSGRCSPTFWRRPRRRACCTSTTRPIASSIRARSSSPTGVPVSPKNAAACTPRR